MPEHPNPIAEARKSWPSFRYCILSFLDFGAPIRRFVFFTTAVLQPSDERAMGLLVAGVETRRRARMPRCGRLRRAVTLSTRTVETETQQMDQQIRLRLLGWAALL